MKHFLKGVGLGLALNYVTRLCCHISNEDLSIVVSLILFFVVTTAFLMSKKVEHLAATGFVGLVAMIIGEIIISSIESNMYLCNMIFYFPGFFGSMGALALSIILTAKKVDLWKYVFMGGKIVTAELSKKSKIMLIVFLVISAISFTLFVMPENAGISVPLFVIIQLVCIWLTSRRSKTGSRHICTSTVSFPTIGSKISIN